MHAVFFRASCLVAAVALTAAGARAGIGEDAPPAFEDQGRKKTDAEIVDRLGSSVPLDVSLVGETGDSVTVREVLAQGDTPVILVLGYYSCPMLCSLVLNGLTRALQDVTLMPGSDYRVVAVSIDPAETPELARAKRASYARALSRPVPEGALSFYVGDAEQVRKLADSVGFGYRFDDDTDQYAHGAGIFFLSPEGVLVRTLFGTEFRPGDVRFALIDAAEGKVGTIVDRIVMSCFQYTADRHRYGVYIWGLLRLAGAATILALLTLLIILWRKERLTPVRSPADRG